VPLKDSENRSYFREFGQITPAGNDKQRKTKISEKRRFTLSKRSLQEKHKNYENLLYNSDTISLPSLTMISGHDNTEKEEAIPWYILNPLSKFRIVWNILLLATMFFNALMVPLRLGFYGDN